MTDEINTTLGVGTVSKRTCERWISNFRENNFNTDDQVREGRPSLDIDEKIIEFLTEDKRATTRNIAEGIDQDKTTVCRHLNAMGYRYLENCWVPHALTQQNKDNRKRICQQLLDSYHRNDFLSQIITCDEIWVYWDNEGAFNNRSWRKSDENPLATPARRLTNRKHLASVFWDSKGLLLLDVLPPNATINADVYCTQLDRLIIAVQQRRRRLLHGGNHNVHYLHDNARPHTAAKTKDKLNALGFTVLPHPPYSPDLSPPDYYLFSPMKCALRGKNYAGVNDINEDLLHWFDKKPRDFFQNGIRSLPGRWLRCIEHNGDYFSHLHDVDD